PDGLLDHVVDMTGADRAGEGRRALPASLTGGRVVIPMGVATGSAPHGPGPAAWASAFLRHISTPLPCCVVMQCESLTGAAIGDSESSGFWDMNRMIRAKQGLKGCGACAGPAPNLGWMAEEERGSRSYRLWKEN